MEDSKKDPSPIIPGFEPPTDLKVPWLSWVIWPVVFIIGIGILALLMRGCQKTVI